MDVSKTIIISPRYNIGMSYLRWSINIWVKKVIEYLIRYSFILRILEEQVLSTKDL